MSQCPPLIVKLLTTSPMPPPPSPQRFRLHLDDGGALLGDDGALLGVCLHKVSNGGACSARLMLCWAMMLLCPAMSSRCSSSIAITVTICGDDTLPDAGSSEKLFPTRTVAPGQVDLEGVVTRRVTIRNGRSRTAPCPSTTAPTMASASPSLATR